MNILHYLKHAPNPEMFVVFQVQTDQVTFYIHNPKKEYHSRIYRPIKEYMVNCLYWMLKYKSQQIIDDYGTLRVVYSKTDEFSEEENEKIKSELFLKGFIDADNIDIYFRDLVSKLVGENIFTFSSFKRFSMKNEFRKFKNLGAGKLERTLEEFIEKKEINVDEANSIIDDRNLGHVYDYLFLSELDELKQLKLSNSVKSSIIVALMYEFSIKQDSYSKILLNICVQFGAAMNQFEDRKLLKKGVIKLYFLIGFVFLFLVVLQFDFWANIRITEARIAEELAKQAAQQTDESIIENVFQAISGLFS